MFGRVISWLRKRSVESREDASIASHAVELLKSEGVDAAAAYLGVALNGMPKRRVIRILRRVMIEARRAEVSVDDIVKLLFAVILLVVVGAIGFTIAYTAAGNNTNALNAVNSLVGAVKGGFSYITLIILVLAGAIMMSVFIKPVGEKLGIKLG